MSKALAEIAFVTALIALGIYAATDGVVNGAEFLVFVGAVAYVVFVTRSAMEDA